MDVKGEVKDRGPGRKFPQFSGRGEHEDFPGRRFRQFIMVIGILLAVVRMFKDVADGHEPFVQSGLMLDALVRPVGCKPVLGHVIHSLCPYLDLKEDIVFVLHRDVKGFVTVRLGV